MTKPAVVFPIWISATDLKTQSEYLSNYLSAGIVDCVVWQLNAVNLMTGTETGRIDTLPPWRDSMTKLVTSANASLASANIPLILVLHPVPYEASPVEYGWSHETQMGNSIDHYASDQQLLRAALDPPHVPLLDLFPQFAANYASRSPVKLFGTRDFHFTPAGNALVANHVLEALTKLRPWVSK